MTDSPAPADTPADAADTPPDAAPGPAGNAVPQPAPAPQPATGGDTFPFLPDDLGQAILDTMLDALIVIDPRGQIHGFNPAATRIFGYAPEEAIGRNINLLMPEPWRSAHDGYLAHYAETGERRIIGTGREVRGRRKDGTTFPMELGVNRMTIGGRTGFVGTIRDISERRRSEEQVRRTLEALRKSNRELDEFAYIASHDLKEPLRGLSNNALFLKEDQGDRLDADGLRRLDRIGFLAARMEQLVDDLLYFSRLGRQDLAVGETDLNAVIAEIAEMIDAMHHDGPVRIRVEGTLPTIVCDRPRVAELFRNLISNAIKYNDKPEKEIVIACAPTADGRPEFRVRDNGIGIEPRFHDEIFRIFKRLNSEDDAVKGTGAGLTFVRKIVERHGGAIRVESAPGEGTSFLFTLEPPPGGEDAQEPAPTAPYAAPSAAAPATATP